MTRNRLFNFTLGTIFASIVVVLLGATFASSNWLLNLTAQFLLLAPFGAVALVAMSLWVGRYWLAANGAVLFVLGSLMAMPWIEPPANPPANARRFALLEFNVWGSNSDPQAVRELITNAKADIVVIVEISDWMRSQLHSLDVTYPNRIECGRRSECGTLILSRFRLDELASVNVPNAEPDLYIRALVETSDCRFTLMTTHLLRPLRPRDALQQLDEAKEIGAVIESTPGANLLVGDFNAAPWTIVMQTILRHGHLSIASGLGGTYPSLLPAVFDLPIDHVLASPALAVASRRVMPSAGSDHLPVKVEIAVLDPNKCR